MKFVRRFRVAIAAAGILVLTLAGGLAATTYEAKVASDQRDAALQAQLRSLAQTAAARLKDGDIQGALGIILEVLPHRGVKAPLQPGCPQRISRRPCDRRADSCDHGSHGSGEIGRICARRPARSHSRIRRYGTHLGCQTVNKSFF